MKITEGKLKGTYFIELKPIIDSRGFFMRAYDRNIFREAGIDRNWVQENHSRSEQKGTIRGLHFQLPPFAETKLIRSIKGAVLDVFVDLRINSATFGKWDSVVLSEENKKYAFIPKGFAHGFCTLTDVSEVLYKVDSIYKPENEVGMLWNDKDLNINWNIENPVLSEKDKKNITLKEFISKYKGIEL